METCWKIDGGMDETTNGQFMEHGWKVGGKRMEHGWKINGT